MKIRTNAQFKYTALFALFSASLLAACTEKSDIVETPEPLASPTPTLGSGGLMSPVDYNQVGPELLSLAVGKMPERIILGEKYAPVAIQLDGTLKASAKIRELENSCSEFVSIANSSIVFNMDKAKAKKCSLMLQAEAGGKNSPPATLRFSAEEYSGPDIFATVRSGAEPTNLSGTLYEEIIDPGSPKKSVIEFSAKSTLSAPCASPNTSSGDTPSLSPAPAASKFSYGFDGETCKNFFTLEGNKLVHTDEVKLFSGKTCEIKVFAKSSCKVGWSEPFSVKMTVADFKVPTIITSSDLISVQLERGEVAAPLELTVAPSRLAPGAKFVIAETNCDAVFKIDGTKLLRDASAAKSRWEPCFAKVTGTDATGAAIVGQTYFANIALPKQEFITQCKALERKRFGEDYGYSAIEDFKGLVYEWQDTSNAYPDVCEKTYNKHQETTDFKYNDKSIDSDVQLFGILKKVKKMDLAGVTINKRKEVLSNISFLTGFPHLKSLNLSRNAITNISVLANLKNLESLNLSENKIKDFSPLKELKNLKTLYISKNEGGIADISFLKEMPGLTVLDLSENKIPQSAEIGDLVHLERLAMSGNSLVSAADFKKLTELQFLDLSRNAFVDVAPLSGLTRLKNLYLGRNRVIDISALANLAELERLEVSGDTIATFKAENIQTIGKFSKLVSLNLDNTKTDDISPLENLKSLKRLVLSRTNVSDISVLKNLTALHSVVLKGANNLSQQACESAFPKPAVTADRANPEMIRHKLLADACIK